jgi:hypothetical protein
MALGGTQGRQLDDDHDRRAAPPVTGRALKVYFILNTGLNAAVLGGNGSKPTFEEIFLHGRSVARPTRLVVRLRLRLRGSRAYLSTAPGLRAQEVRARRSKYLICQHAVAVPQ